MTPDEQLFELLVVWDEARREGRVLTPELLAPDNLELQQRLHQAIAKQQKMQRAFQSTVELTEALANDCPEALPVVPGYQLQRLIGRGGMGSVYEAHDHQLNRTVAIKLLLAEYALNSTAKARFLREARSAAAVPNEYVVTIHTVNEVEGTPFIVMEYLRGQPLDQWMTTQRVSMSEVIRIGHEIATGLAAAHAKGLIHRDVKPANIWLEAPSGRVKLLDFGLARSVQGDAEITRSGVIVGTPAYMAPEQARSQPVDHRCDLFSLGSVLYHLATGKRPFSGTDTYGILTSLAMDTPRSPRFVNPHVPESLSNLIDRLLCKNPADRPQTAQEVADILQRLARNEAIRVAPVPLPAPVVEALPTDSGAGEVWSRLDASNTEIAPRVPKEKPKSRLQPRFFAFGTAVLGVCVLALAIGMFNKFRTPAPNVVELPPDTPPPTEVGSTDKPYELIEAQAPTKPAKMWSLDHLRYETHVPPNERFPWQPKELVGVFGTHQHKSFGQISELRRNADGTTVLAVSGTFDQSILLDVATNKEFVVPHAATGLLPDGKHLFHGNESFPPESPYQNRIKYPVTGPIYEFFRADLVFANHDNQKGIWQFENGRAKLIIDCNDAAESWAVAPDGAWFLAQTADWQVRVYRISDPPILVHTFPKQPNRVGFALANDVLAITNGEKIQLWRLGGKELMFLQEFTDQAWHASRLTFSPDGTRLLHDYRMFDVTTKPAKQIATDPTKYIHQFAAVFMDNNQALIGAMINTLVRWPIRGEQIERPPSLLPDNYASHSHNGRLLAISPDGRWLTCNATSHDHTKPLKQALLDLPSWQPHTLMDDNRATTATFSPTSTRLLLDWPMWNAQSIWGHWAHPVDAADVALMAKTGERWLEDSSLRLQSFSPDGSLVAGARQYGNVTNAVVKRFEKKRLVDRSSIATRFAPARYIEPTVRFNNTGQYLIGIGENKDGQSDIVTWALTTTGLREIHRRSHSCNASSWLPIDRDDTALLSGATPLIRYDFITGKILKEYPALANTASFDVSPDGQWLIGTRAKSPGLYLELILVHEKSGKVVHSWTMPSLIEHVRFHPDGRHILCINGNGTIYALRIGPLLLP